MGCASLLLAGTVASVASVAAQDKPDFSGQWELVAAAPSGAGAATRLTVRQPSTRTNVFGAPTQPSYLQLIVERVLTDHSTTDTYQIGVESGTIGGDGSRTHSSVRWEENRIVMATSTSMSEHKEIWALDPNGLLIIAVTDDEAGREQRSNTLTYRRD